ncbi:HNH endonuclease signature motif containing protein [Streptomyces lycii]|uniref:HNH endonuclease n=1 Tax=Streptomyces lycii TaxID=2654337 RepID=A0ABQ7FLL4_9ACTN|nr:HNH endonuclease signature motif containing protein [Streptomyces lycii]KAF4408666.1 HNH endonuclease [Streptomyces lycii]
MASPREGRNTYAYRQLRDQQRALGLPCWLCGRPVDYSVKGVAARSHPWAFSLDHVVPLSKGGSLLDPLNARTAHMRCNRSKGNRPAQLVPNKSRDW